MTAPLDELAEALAAFQAECPVIPKKQTARIQTQGGRDYSYTYADLATIAPVVLPLLAKHGLSFICLPTARKDAPPMLRGMLVHKSGQRVRGELPITGRTPQEIGSSLTYGRRYLLGCLTGVVTDEDEDGQLATRAARSRRTAGPPEDPAPVAPPTPIARANRPRSVDAPAPKPLSPHGPTADDGGTGASKADSTPDAARRAMFGAIGKALGPNAQRAERLALCAAILGRDVTSSDDMDARDVSRVLGWLEDRDAGRVDWSYDPYAERGYVYAIDTGEVGPGDHD